MKNSAPGPDRIHPQMLKHLTNRNMIYLTLLFNYIWSNHEFPSQWRVAHILPTYKMGKDKLNPTSYRPVSLTNVLCKILEKIVVKRLRLSLEIRKVLDKFQSDFRSQRSTLDNLVYLTEEVRYGFSRQQHTLCVFFDMEKAFDRLHPAAILNSLQQLQYHGNIFYFIQNFLADRSFQVRVGNHLSTTRKQEVGTPQGSVLSPLLFILAVNSISEILSYPIYHTFYADDLAIFTRGDNLEEMVKLLQEVIHKLVVWSEARGLRFSAAKSSVVNFTRKRNVPTITLSLYGNRLPVVSTVKFLGITLDSKLNWCHYIAELKKKCLSRLNLLKMLNGSSGGADRKCLLRL